MRRLRVCEKSCGWMQMEVRNFLSDQESKKPCRNVGIQELPLYKIVLASPSDFGVDHIDATGLEHSQTPATQSFCDERCMSWVVMSLRGYVCSQGGGTVELQSSLRGRVGMAPAHRSCGGDVGIELQKQVVILRR